jgi:hypothetical protein
LAHPAIGRADFASSYSDIDSRSATASIKEKRFWLNSRPSV